MLCLQQLNAQPDSDLMLSIIKDTTVNNALISAE